MTELVPGAAAPAFTLPSDAGTDVSLADFAGRKVILYFYPKDNTSGCTIEAQQFRDALSRFAAAGYAVLGVSRDSVKSHCGFREKQQLNFPLLSDKEEVVVNAFGVLKEKMMCGRKCFGIERSTFVIDETGKLTHVLRNVKAKTHVEELLKLLEVA